MVAVGADLAPGTLLQAYRSGMFPMPGPDRRDPMHWWSPARRGVLPLDGMRVSRSLRQSCKHFEIRVDSAFDEVVAGCADPERPDGWIDDRINAAYTRLHRLGWAHSVEASRARVNIDSPANRPPMATPYRPPASVPPCHASTEWAQPSRCSRV